jgi:hypothetical protein
MRVRIVAAVGAAVIVAGVAVYALRAGRGGATRATSTSSMSMGMSTEMASDVAPVARVAAKRGPSPGLSLRGGGGGSGGGLADAAPGATAFRGLTDDYVDAMPAVAKEHMAREGLTLDETRELTYFAVLAVESQDWGRVESLTGKALSGEQRREAWEAMMARSQEMTREMHEQIAAGGDEGARWDVIAKIEGGYLGDYYRITGMNPALLDQLLLASVKNQRVSETLASLSPQNNEPPVASGARSGTFVRRDPRHPERPPVPVEGDAP